MTQQKQEHHSEAELKAETKTEVEAENHKLLTEENRRLKEEIQVLRKALVELELQELTLAHQFLSTSLNIRALLQSRQ